VIGEWGMQPGGGRGRGVTALFAGDSGTGKTMSAEVIAGELGLPWRTCRGLAVIARAIGLVAHIQEETEEPLAAEIWSRIEDESSSHIRPSTD